MLCPVCTDKTLVMSERNGVEIDYCPACRGVWLDRGELDKILARTATEAAPAAVPQVPMQSGRPWNDGGYPPKRRKSFFEELFD